ncbi:MAG TPA: hypothetical protein VI895_09225 [Bdellovibrionota bacterium]|nr:hypothetical protein [Bdellovibrionota bacterium]
MPRRIVIPLLFSLTIGVLSCGSEAGKIDINLTLDQSVDQTAIRFFLFVVKPTGGSGTGLLFPNCLSTTAGGATCIQTPAACGSSLPATQSSFELELPFDTFPLDAPIDITACAVKDDLSNVASGQATAIANTAGGSSDISMTAGDATCSTTILAVPRC